MKDPCRISRKKFWPDDLEVMENEPDMVVHIMCGHLFHRTCITAAFLEVFVCPLCAHVPHKEYHQLVSASKLHPMIDEVSKKQLRADHLNRTLVNRDGVDNTPVIRFGLPATEVDVKFLDFFSNFDLNVRMGKDCPQVVPHLRQTGVVHCKRGCGVLIDNTEAVWMHQV